MRRRAIRPGVILATFVTTLVGLVTLLGLLLGDIPVPEALAENANFEAVPTGALAQYAVQISGLALALMIVLGIINLVGVHLERTLRGRSNTGRLTSIVIVLVFIATITLYVLELEADEPQLTNFLLNDVQVTIESALAALLFFSLVYGGYRMLRGRVTSPRVLFIITVLIVLIGSLYPARTDLEPFALMTDWLFTVPVNAGARGIVLGIALVTVVTGVRVLIGQDRSYGE